MKLTHHMLDGILSWHHRYSAPMYVDMTMTTRTTSTDGIDTHVEEEVQAFDKLVMGKVRGGGENSTRPKSDHQISIDSRRGSESEME